MKRTIFLLAGFLYILTYPIEGITSHPADSSNTTEDLELNNPLLDMSAEPSSIIGGAVNVITGNYVECECDLILPGSNPLIIQRSFNSGSKERGTLCHGWNLNLPSEIKIEETKNAKHPLAAFVNDRGVSLLFVGNYSKSMKLEREQLRYGVTNCSNGILSSNTNIRNKKLYYKRDQARNCVLKEETGEELSYNRISISHGKVKYAISKNLLPNGCSFSYDYDDKKRLLSVISKGGLENPISNIKWIYPSTFDTTPELSLVSSDGRTICYKYQKQLSKDGSKHRFCLTSVLKVHAPEVHYFYSYVNKHLMERMIRKTLPDHRYINVQYYEKGINNVGSDVIEIGSSKDSRVGRVSALYAPVGTDETPIMTWKVKYNLNKHHRSSKPIGGSAEVFDALGHRKIYYFSDEQRLLSVKHMLDDGSLYRNEKMVWRESGDYKTFLLARGLIDRSGNLLFRKNYTYEKNGNVLQENFRGNLTGSGNEAVKWNLYRNTEKYSKTYTYTDSGLLASEQDERKKTIYNYVKGTNLVSLKLVYDTNDIRERYHYVYDLNGTLVEEITDDGNSKDINNLAGVTERRIKKIYPTLIMPIGLPRVIEEWFINFATGKEELLSRVENSYSKEGYLLIQKFYDSSNNYQYSKEWSYDLRGNVIQEIDPLGQITTSQYDLNNNRVYQQTPNIEFYTIYSYDYANRLIREEKIYHVGDKPPVLVQSYSYDYIGNRVAITDKYMNTTKFLYDEFGRLIETIYPSILNTIGELEQPITKVTYDCMNNPCQKTDTNGHITEIKYTAWRKPYYIHNPDGTVERSIYHLDGTLKKDVDAIGVETLYTYDYKGRKIKEEKMSPEGEALSVREWVFNAFNLLEEIDPAGYKTVYTYDGAGRIVFLRKGDSETRYVYDSLGRQSEIWEMYETGKYRRSVIEYDFLNRVVRETVMDEGSFIFSMKSYKYDADGNRTHEIIHDNQCDSCIETVYNSEKKPVKIIQPDGGQTLYEYVNDFKNELGQNVAFEKEIDPKGIQTIKIMDACGRLRKEEKKDSEGNLLQSTLYCHDGEGNLVSRTDDLLIESVVQKSIRIEFLFDSQNREIASIEAAGDPLEKITRKEYHSNGELAKIIKPDGVILSNEYDYLRCLIAMDSSDGSIHYFYKYDQNSNLIEVEDLVHGITTIRILDENNRMISEKLGTGLQFSYKYDPRGRVKKLVLPNFSTVEYFYDAANLCAINRTNNGSSFKCDYQYNLSGKIAKMRMPNAIGDIYYGYDSCLRTTIINSKYWSQMIPEGGYDTCGNLIKICQKDVVGEQTSCYTYDSLHHVIAETGIAEHSYSFDSLHNRISKNGTYHNINVLNQLTQQGEKNYEYDLNGNQSKTIDSENKTTYQYDALDRLIATTIGNQRTEYLYDSFHRRLKKTTFVLQANGWVETDVCTFLYQGDKEIGAFDKDGQLIQMRTLGLGNTQEIGAAVLLEINDLTLIPLHDFRGNVVALVDVNNGKLLECFRYTAYGEEQAFDSYGNRQEMIFCPWRFCSKRIDSETGWVFFGRRYYDSEVGKWTTPDPLRFIDSPNVYCFVRNRPMRYLDADGRSISKAIGDNYELWANCINSNCMKEFGGVEWSALETPNYFHYSTKYRVGTPRNDGLGMTFVNGIGNTLKDSVSAAVMYSNMAGGREVLGVHNASFGSGFDLIECTLGLCGVATTSSKLIQENWDECWSYSKSRLLHIGHSQGMIHTVNTTPTYDEELRQRIEVIGVAPGAHAKRGDFKKAIHYESSRDFVPWFDKIVNGTKNCAPIVTLKPHSEAPLFDHFNDSPTYQQPVENRIQAFFKVPQ